MPAGGARYPGLEDGPGMPYGDVGGMRLEMGGSLSPPPEGGDEDILEELL